MRKRVFLAFVATGLVILGIAAPVHAACLYDPALVWHGLGATFTNCADNIPVNGFVYEVDNAGTVNSASQDFACEVGGVTNGIGVPCQPEAGDAGDGVVTVSYNWGAGNVGSVGCPNPDPISQGAGSNVIALQIVDNDGKGAIVTVGFDAGLNGYTLEAAYPYDGETLGEVVCTYDNAPQVVSIGAGPSPSLVNVCLRVPVPSVHSDCDPTSAGSALGSCPGGPAAKPATGRGRLYTRVADCFGHSPDIRLSTGWQLLPVQPDADGNACNLVDRPSSSCTFVGTSANIGDLETLAIVGSFRLIPFIASNDRLTIDHAAITRGRLVVKFSTINETSIVGFNLYAGETRLNQATLQAEGFGSNSYSFEIGRGALRSSREVTVEAIKSDGTVEKITAPLN